MATNALFRNLIGKWSGICKTWFEPDKLSDESIVHGEFTFVLGSSFLRHVYSGEIQGKPRNGEELIALNSVTEQYEVNWIDDFHMNYAMLFSQGPATPTGFSVTGEYGVELNQPKWGWRTQYDLQNRDSLTITSYNISPDGEESIALEVKYKRV